MGGKEKKRRSRDENEQAEGVRLVEDMKGQGMEMLNGLMKGDEEGEHTFIGHQGESVIDYVWVDGQDLEEIRHFEVAIVGGSDHLPLVVELWRKGSERGREKCQWKEIELWTDKAVTSFQRESMKLTWEGDTVEEKVNDLVEKVNSIVVKKRVRIK